MEYLESTPNANTVDTHPATFKIFRGKWGLCLMGGVLAFIMINSVASRVFSAPFSFVLSAAPCALLALYLILFVNGKLPHYKDDLFLTGLFHVMAFLYLRGWLKRPPQLWRKIKRPSPVV